MSSVSPVGSDPDVIAHVPGAFASSWSEYAAFKSASNTCGVVMVSAIATGGVVIPACTSSVLTDSAMTAGETLPAGWNVTSSLTSGSKTRNVICAVSPGASASVAFSMAGFSIAGFSMAGAPPVRNEGFVMFTTTTL